MYEAQKFDRSSARIELSSQLNKRFFVKANYRIRKNPYYSTPEQGWGHNFNGGVNWQASDKFNAELTYIYSDLYSDANGEQFYQVHIPRVRVTYQMNQYLFFRVIAQYNSQTEQIARISWHHLLTYQERLYTWAMVRYSKKRSGMETTTSKAMIS